MLLVGSTLLGRKFRASVKIKSRIFESKLYLGHHCSSGFVLGRKYQPLDLLAVVDSHLLLMGEAREGAHKWGLPESGDAKSIAVENRNEGEGVGLELASIYGGGGIGVAEPLEQSTGERGSCARGRKRRSRGRDREREGARFGCWVLSHVWGMGWAFWGFN